MNEIRAIFNNVIVNKNLIIFNFIYTTFVVLQNLKLLFNINPNFIIFCEKKIDQQNLYLNPLFF